jgi:ParB family chromosome partitioning protein
MMPPAVGQKVEMVPISRISVLNPRARNKRQHRDIVNNIEMIGLKRPITVSKRQGPGSPRYDLVCGQGRLEAFQMLGHVPRQRLWHRFEVVI